MSQQTFTILASIVGPAIGILGTWMVMFLNRKNTKAQTEGLIADQYYKLTERLGEERNELIKRIARNDDLINSLERKHRDNNNEIKMLKEDNNECKYLHEVAELELKLIAKHNILKNLKKEKVFVLDDDLDVIDEFRHRFNRLSVLDFHPFLDMDKFLKEVRISKPQIIVVDYILSSGKTAEDVIDSLNYTPEVFIMSTEEGFKSKFIGQDVRFFVKEKNYILEIVRDIIKYLNTKNKI